jgi:hypothetical protein
MGRAANQNVDDSFAFTVTAAVALTLIDNLRAL